MRPQACDLSLQCDVRLPSSYVILYPTLCREPFAFIFMATPMVNTTAALMHYPQSDEWENWYFAPTPDMV